MAHGTQTSSNPQKPVGVSLHARTHHRARQRLEEQEHLGVTPRHRLTYLKRWSNWWHLKDLLPLSDTLISVFTSSLKDKALNSGDVGNAPLIKLYHSFLVG